MAVTWNPADKDASIVLSNGDLTTTTSVTGYHGVRATSGHATGKRYFEITLGTVDEFFRIGLAKATWTLTSIGAATTGWGYKNNGYVFYNDTGYGPALSFATGDIISVAVDLDAHKLWFGVNGVWSGDPAAGTGAVMTNLTDTLYPAFSAYTSGNSATANFGDTAFAYEVPSGFNPGWDTTVTGDISDDATASYATDADVYGWRFIAEDASVSTSFLDNMGEVSEDITANFYLFDNLADWLTGASSNVQFLPTGIFNANLYEETTIGTRLVGTVFYDLLIEDGFDQTDFSDRALRYSLTIEDGVLFVSESDGVPQKVGYVLDGVMIWDAALVGWGKTVVDTFDAADVVTKTLGLLIPDVLTPLDVVLNNWDGVQIVEESVFIYDSLVYAQYLKSIADSLVATDVVNLLLVLSVSDSLKLEDKIPLSISIIVPDTITATDLALWGWDELIADTFASTDEISSLGSFGSVIADAAIITDEVSRNYLLRSVIAESLVGVDAASSNLSMVQTVAENLHLSVAIILTGETYECWVLNTPAFHTSIYSGFNFNSYCTFNGRAFAANPTGIYELTGEDDAGTAINTGVVLSNTELGIPTAKRVAKARIDASGTAPVMVLEVENGAREIFYIDEFKTTKGNKDVKGRKWKVSVVGFDSLDSMKLTPEVLSR